MNIKEKYDIDHSEQDLSLYELIDLTKDFGGGKVLELTKGKDGNYYVSNGEGRSAAKGYTSIASAKQAINRNRLGKKLVVRA